MRGFPRPWYIAGGWAIDIFLGRETREHDDIDVSVLRNDQAKLRTHLAAGAFEQFVDGRLLPRPDGDWLNLPVHEVHATSETRARVEFLLNESSGASWQFRRNPAITRRLDRIGMRTSAGVPFLVPEIVLLFKAKASGATDARDLVFIRTRLRDEPGRWLNNDL